MYDSIWWYFPLYFLSCANTVNVTTNRASITYRVHIILFYIIPLDCTGYLNKKAPLLHAEIMLLERIKEEKPNFILILISLGSNVQVSHQLNVFIYSRRCDFHACTAFHALNCDMNILIKLIDFTTMISVKEYYDF